MDSIRWTRDGPRIPLNLIHAAEDGRLVFFCGAGVSQQAGLPGFKGLVDRVYELLRRDRTIRSLEVEAYDHDEFDHVFWLLEKTVGQPQIVRQAVAEALELAPEADIGTHAALLSLATGKTGACHLVTTNYDRCFAECCQRYTRIDAAPRLPVPQPGRWNSIVHLHGYLGDGAENLRELVLSSADFGAAYLTEGWATRFLLELFRNFVVLFVGYSADDAVVRYMLQAISISRCGDGGPPRVYALAEAKEPLEDTRRAWRAKGIEPILYGNLDGRYGSLHQTLRRWAERASLSVAEQARFVAGAFETPPPPDRNELVDQIVWALGDRNGAVAKELAKTPASPRHWLRVLDDKGLFSLDGIALVNPDYSAIGRPLHPVTEALGRWLTEHLHEPELAKWVLAKKGRLHPHFSSLVRWAIADNFDQIPDPQRRIWLFLSRPDSGPSITVALARSIRLQVKHSESVSAVAGEVAVLLRPRFALSTDCVTELLDDCHHPAPRVEVQLAGREEIGDVLELVRKRPDRDRILAHLLDHATSCLRDAMEAFQHFGQASAWEDATHVRMPRITTACPAPPSAVTTLVSLVAECLEAACNVDRPLGRAQVERWKALRFPVFGRLICFALGKRELFTVSSRSKRYWMRNLPFGLLAAASNYSTCSPRLGLYSTKMTPTD